MSRVQSRPQGQLRRQPTRDTGRAIVDAIVEGARRLIEREGSDALTTNRIAAEAGVSIGSLYQYFPDREAVLAEIARRIEQQTLMAATERVAQVGDDLGALVDGMVDLLTSSILGGLDTRATLLREVPRAHIRNVSAVVDEEVTSMVCDLLVTHAARLPNLGNPRIMAFMLVTTVEAIVEGGVERHPQWMESGALRDHLCMLIRRVLGLPEHAESTGGLRLVQ